MHLNIYASKFNFKTAKHQRKIRQAKFLHQLQFHFLFKFKALEDVFEGNEEAFLNNKEKKKEMEKVVTDETHIHKKLRQPQKNSSVSDEKRK